MPKTARQHQVLLSHAAPETYAPMTRLLLAKLGYLILSPEELASIDGGEAFRPVLLLLDESQLSSAPAVDHAVPILMVTSKDKDREPGEAVGDSRVAGVVRCPVQSEDLFRLIQQLTERTPRSTPRVDCEFDVRCRQGDREWSGVLASISEKGGLLRRPELPELGSRLVLSFELPGIRRLKLSAETAYYDLQGAGVVFCEPSESDRAAIAGFVRQRLLGG